MRDQCGAGALSAAFSKAALLKGAIPNDFIGGTIASAVVGGTASVLGGGQFANGAKTAAFGYLFNQAATAARAAAGAGAGAGALQAQANDRIARAIGNFVSDFFNAPSQIIDWALSTDGEYRERALTSAGVTSAEAKGLDVHHVVMKGNLAMAPSVAALNTVGIDIHSLDNLVILPRADHQMIHTPQYISAVNALLTAAAPSGYTATARSLDLVKTALIVNGKFP